MTNRERAQEIIDTCPCDLSDCETWSTLKGMILEELDEAERRGMERIEKMVEQVRLQYEKSGDATCGAIEGVLESLVVEIRAEAAKVGVK